MLLLLRILSIAAGTGTLLNVLGGRMTNPLFIVADLVAGAALVIAALLPRPSVAPALVAAHGYALGVFSVALADYIVPGRPVNPLLVLVMAVNLGTIVALLPGLLRRPMAAAT